MLKEDVMQLIEDEDVEFIRLQFTDAFGNLKNMAVTPGQMERVFADKYSFAGQAMFSELCDFDEELYLHPDANTFVILPWRPQQGKVAKIICDVYTVDGEPVEASPRYILKKVLENAKAKGYTFMVDPECEFFLFHTDENGLPTTITHELASYMDVGPVDFGENARRDIVLMLEEMGYDIQSSFHEKAPAQHEVDFAGAEASKIADSIVTFRFAVRSIAKRFGLYATFMPKPRNNEAGSSIHFQFSAYKNGKNVFASENDEISEEARFFMGGVLAHAKAICAITNPLVNSYKRLMTGFDAPNSVSWSERGERAAVKLNKNGLATKVEMRFPDAACDPYLAIALLVAAGLDGIENKIEPGKDMRDYAATEKGPEALPVCLKDALNALKEDELLTSVLGKQFMEVYCAGKEQEWNDYTVQVTDWEINRYLIKM